MFLVQIKRKRVIVFTVCLLFSVFSYAEVYLQNAVVSYYAEAFHGKKTSNGETYNMNAYTCASKELPFNTKLKITNLSNNKTVTVRVNDRGPFVPDRALDLSKAAAIKLDMIKSGTAHVKIEIIEKGPDTKVSQQTAEKAKKLMAQRFPNKTVTTTRAPKKHWDVQLGAFSTRENANNLAQKLLREGFTDVVFQKSEGVFRVVIRNVPTEELDSLEEKLKRKGHSGYTIRERKS